MANKKKVNEKGKFLEKEIIRNKKSLIHQIWISSVVNAILGIALYGFGLKIWMLTCIIPFIFSIEKIYEFFAWNGEFSTTTENGKKVVSFGEAFSTKMHSTFMAAIFLAGAVLGVASLIGLYIAIAPYIIKVLIGIAIFVATGFGFYWFVISNKKKAEDILNRQF